jgi:indole-3-glycerol phosphate synthase
LRRLSHAIAEGDGISVLVEVDGGASARAAEAQGAEGVVLTRPADGVRDATQLPVLWFCGGDFRAATSYGVDAVVLVAEDAGDDLEDWFAATAELGLECVVKVRDEEELEDVLERVDPELLLLSAEEADDGQLHLDRVLELLPDVPAGKLAIAELARAGRGEIEELERAGVDAVLVAAGDVSELVGGAPPAV